MGRIQSRTSIVTRLAWPLSVTLLACGASQGADPGDGGGDSGSSGSSSGSAGTRSSSGGTEAGGGGTAGASSGGATATGGATTGPAGSGGASSDAGESNAGGSAAGDGPIGGSSGAGGDLPGIDSASRVTIRSKSANLDTATGECDTAAPGFEDDAVWSSWTFERATNTFAWEYCKGYPGMWESSSRTLSEAEAQGILNALTLITPSQEGLCFADGGRGELEILAGGVTTLYRPDTGWCGSEPDGVNYVRGMHSLWAWFENLADPFVIPPAPERLTLYTGEIPTGPFPNAECSENPLPVEYELDVPARMLSWRGMSSDPNAGGAITYCPTETRLLETAELDALLAAYELLAPGASAACDALERPASLDEPGGQIPWMKVGIEALIDETDSCYGGSSRPYTIGVAALARAVAALTE